MSKNPIEVELINTIKNYDGSNEAQSNFFDILNELEEISSDVIDAALEKGNEQLINLILETEVEKGAVKLDKKVQQEIELEVAKAEEIAQQKPVYAAVFQYDETSIAQNKLVDVVSTNSVDSEFDAVTLAYKNVNANVGEFLSDALYGEVIKYQDIIDAKARITAEQKNNPIVNAVYHNDGSKESLDKIEEMIQNPNQEFVVTKPAIALEEKTALMYNNKELLDVLTTGYNLQENI